MLRGRNSTPPPEGAISKKDYADEKTAAKSYPGGEKKENVDKKHQKMNVTKTKNDSRYRSIAELYFKDHTVEDIMRELYFTGRPTTEYFYNGEHKQNK